MVVDEIETHLYLLLQEQILPFLTELFPCLQIIVATHSPAVIASISGAIVCDLGTREQALSDHYRGIPYGRPGQVWIDAVAEGRVTGLVTWHALAEHLHRRLRKAYGSDVLLERPRGGEGSLKRPQPRLARHGRRDLRHAKLRRVDRVHEANMP